MKSPLQSRPDGGCLYLVATPIGHLEDITLRALRVLKEVDVIACEDTRQTRKLLTHYRIQKRLVSYHQHNEITRGAELMVELEQGAQIALVSDAGMPLISDPGHHLLALCRRHRIPVVPVPGPSAVVASLAASGLPTESFLFRGFLPSRPGERRRALMDLASLGRQVGTLIVYEAPHRLVGTLADMAAILGNRQAVVAREVTKLHEEFRGGSLQEVLVHFEAHPPRGEITLLVAPPDGSDEVAAPTARAPAADVPLKMRVEQLVREQSLDSKAALKQAARERGITKREAYKQMLTQRD
ncbi:MAG: 16S rRNA (cytidine(1402)-2'-O)-methyltransferase [Candidatus Acidiferrales bacterium]